MPNRRALDTAVDDTSSIWEHAILSRGKLCMSHLPVWSANSVQDSRQALLDSISRGFETLDSCTENKRPGAVEGGGAAGGGRAGVGLTIHCPGPGVRDGMVRAQRRVYRLYAPYGADDEVVHTLALCAGGLALGLAGMRQLLRDIGGRAGVGDEGPGRSSCVALETEVAGLWHHCGANLYRQAKGSEVPGAEEEGAGTGRGGGLSTLTARLAGWTGGRASALVRRAVASISALTMNQTDSRALEQLALTRSAFAREQRRRWRLHGRLSRVERSLWEYRDVRVMCGSWNTKGCLLPHESFRGWFAPALAEWGKQGAEIVVIGIQEGVSLGAVNLMKDAGSLLVDALDDGSPPLSPRGDADVNGGSSALAAWQKEIELAIHALRTGDTEDVQCMQVVDA